MGLLHIRSADVSFSLSRWQHSTPSVDDYLPKEHLLQISSRSDLEWWSLGLFEEVARTKTKKKNKI